MQTESHWASQRFGARGARLALVVSGLIFMILMGGWAVIETLSAWRLGHTLRGVLIGAVALLLIFLSQRILALNWRATRAAEDRPALPPDGNDQSGVWGVGGPSMREPGSTGAWPIRAIDRRYEDRGD